jgi:hypothetical protein
MEERERECLMDGDVYSMDADMANGKSEVIDKWGERIV